MSCGTIRDVMGTQSAQLASVAEIAARLDVTKATVSTWRARGLLPRPVAVLACGPIWRMSDILDFAARTGRGASVRRGEVTSADMRSAASYLSVARSQCLAELRSAADTVRHLLAEPIKTPISRALCRDGAGRIAPSDGRGNGVGEWDWYYQLAASERSRLRKWMSDTGLAPDQYAAINAHGANDDIDLAMAQWQRATALAEAVRAVERGRAPAVPVDCATSYDVAELFGPEPVEYLAREIAAEREHYGADQIAPTWDENYKLEEVF